MHSVAVVPLDEGSEPKGHPGGSIHVDSAIEPFPNVVLPDGQFLQLDFLFNPLMSEYVPIGHSPSQWLSVVHVN